MKVVAFVSGFPECPKSSNSDYPFKSYGHFTTGKRFRSVQVSDLHAHFQPSKRQRNAKLIKQKLELRFQDFQKVQDHQNPIIQ